MNKRNRNNFTTTNENQQTVNVDMKHGYPQYSYNNGVSEFYTIEDHLKSFEWESKLRYLYNSWYIEKLDYIRQLDTIPVTYTDYSLHNKSHSEKIITSIERLLGPERIALLSPGDAWLILQSAYTHDLGMCVTESEKYSFLKSNEVFRKEICRQENQLIFEEILDEIYKRENRYSITRSHDKVRQAAEYWIENRNALYTVDSFRDKVLSDEFSIASYYLNEVVKEFFRGKHAERSRDMLLNRRYNSVERDMIPGHMREAVAQIVYRHCGSPAGIENDLERRQNGFSTGDFIHPRFVAALLRLGDLLDMETTRFNPYFIDGLAYVSSDNKAYLIKDLSVSEILVDRYTISVTSSFETNHIRNFLFRHKDESVNGTISDEKINQIIAKAIKYMRIWMDYIKQNLEWVWAHWDSLAPNDFPGSIAAPIKLVIKLDGKECDENEMELIYEIDPRRTAQIIEGEGFYGSRLVFLREIIQNAADATKLNFYRTYQKDISRLIMNNMHDMYNIHDMHNVQNIDSDIPISRFLTKYKDELNNAKVKVDITFSKEKDVMTVKVTDCGVGITRKRLGAMRCIGATKDLDVENEFLKTPDWLRPTASFGIGMQSAFLVADKFFILTNPIEKEKAGKDTSDDDMQRRISFNNTKLGGDISCIDSVVNPGAAECWEEEPGNLYPNGIRYPNGTRFIIDIDLERPTELIGSYVSCSMEEYITYRMGLVSVLKKRCKEYLEEIFTESLIPIEINIEGIDNSIKYNPTPFAEAIYLPDFQNVRFDIINGVPIAYFWYDNYSIGDHFCALFKYTPTGSNVDNTTKLFYRGIKFGEKEDSLVSFLHLPGLICHIDIMSGNANDFLEVNREYVRKASHAAFLNNSSSGIRSFIDHLLKLAHFLQQNALKSSEYSTVAGVFENLLLFSPDFANMLLLQAVTDSNNASSEAKNYIANIIRSEINTAILNKRNATVTFATEPITNDNQPSPKIIDYYVFNDGSTLELDKTDERFNIVDHNNGIIKAIQNKYAVLSDKKYKSMEAYIVNSYQLSTRKIINIYTLGDDVNITEIDKYSYKIIVRNIINDYKTNNDDTFPVLPAPSKYLQMVDLSPLIIKSPPPIVKDFCDNRYASYVFAPYPTGIIDASLAEQKIIRAMCGINCATEKEKRKNYSTLIRYYLDKKAYRRDDEFFKEYDLIFGDYKIKYKQYYLQMFNYIKKFGGISNEIGANKNEINLENIIIDAIGYFADYLVDILT